MPYFTMDLSPIYPQITLEDLLTGKAKYRPVITNESNTRTIFTDKSGEALYGVDWLQTTLRTLRRFVDKYKPLYETADRHELYNTFPIPKNSGGLRWINAPVPELSIALYELRSILNDTFHAKYHTNAFAYIKRRSTIDAVKRHRNNESNWYMKLDFHDFFGSTTKDFMLATLSEIVPFNLICRHPEGAMLLEKALDLCFLDGGLPQGTPISPMLTNIVMIPVDFKLTKRLREFDKHYFIYTRYADDMLISSKWEFSPKKVQALVREVLSEVNAPYTFKESKTRYGSRAGSNWNLGLMINKNNDITVGHKAKKRFRAMCHNYILDKQHGTNWELSDVQAMSGLLSYYLSVEPEYFTHLLSDIGTKHNVNLPAMIKADLKAA